jgi:hypothetical protein
MLKTIGFYFLIIVIFPLSLIAQDFSISGLVKDITRRRIGLSSTKDYIFRKNSTLYLRGMYNSFSDEELRRRKSYNVSDAISETLYRDGSIDHDIRDRTRIQEIYSLNLGGSNQINWLKIDYETACSLSQEKEPDWLETTNIFPRYPRQFIATGILLVGGKNWSETKCLTDCIYFVYLELKTRFKY